MLRNPEQIKREVVEHLVWDSRIDASLIQVEVDRGIVKLTGEVPTYRAMAVAEDDARSIRGVTAVDNELLVTKPERETGPTDEEIRDKVASLLSWSSEVTPSDMLVSVQDGVVILEGTVHLYWEKLKAEELASNLEGVVGVSNQLAVVPAPSVIDRDIAHEITAALDRHPSIDITAVDVQVSGGVVTLSGVVPDWTAYQAAQEAAQFTEGVIEVDNQLVFPRGEAAT